MLHFNYIFKIIFTNIYYSPFSNEYSYVGHLGNFSSQNYSIFSALIFLYYFSISNSILGFYYRDSIKSFSNF